MRVILQKTVRSLGLVGDLVDVKPGFYRNYLGPQKLALYADEGNIKQWEHHKRIVEAKKAKEKTSALELKNNMEKKTYTTKHAAGEGDRLFGSITSSDVVVLLNKEGFAVDRKLVTLITPIKTVGVHTVSVKLHPEVSAEVKIEVLKKEEPKQKKTTEKTQTEKKPKQAKAKVEVEKTKETTQEVIKEKPKKEKSESKSKKKK